jgi:hypothetical protein
MVQACYTCRFHTAREETRPGRGAQRGRWVERCHKLGIQLKVAAVAADGPLGLISVPAYDQSAQTAGAYIFGSPGRFFDRNGSVRECDHYQRKERFPKMKQYETRTEYTDAIARVLGLGNRDDLSYPHRDMLGVENFSRLAPILDMIEIAAGQRDQQDAADDAEALTAKLIAVGQVVQRHRESKVKAVQTLIEEIEAVLDGKEEADTDVP